MPITKAIRGANVPASDLAGQDLNALIEQGIISPREGGQSFEFLQPWTAPVLPDKAPVSGAIDLTTMGGFTDFLSKQGLMPNGLATSVDMGKMLETQITGIEETEEQRRATVEAGATAARGLITSQFEDLVGRVRQQMEQEAGGITAIGARRAGLGASTALQANLQLAQQAGQQRITDLTRQKEEALLRQDIKAAASIDASLAREQDTISKFYKDAWDMNMDIFNIQNVMLNNQRAEVQMSWNIISKLPKGETWTSPAGTVYTGIAEEDIDPFFTGANIVSLMKEIPVGETQTITDPNTGTEWTISGLGQPDLNTSVIQSTDASGNVIITTINKDTGEIISQVNAGRIGKGIQAPASFREFQLAGGEEGTGMTFAQFLQTGVGEGAKITITKAQNLGLPISTVGMTEIQIAQDLQSSITPDWFVQSEQKKAKATIFPAELSKRWEQKRAEITTQTNKQGEFDFGRQIVESNVETVSTNPTSQNIAALYNALRANTELDVSDAKSVMSEFGFEESFGQWTFIGF